MLKVKKIITQTIDIIKEHDIHCESKFYKLRSLRKLKSEPRLTDDYMFKPYHDIYFPNLLSPASSRFYEIGSSTDITNYILEHTSDAIHIRCICHVYC